MHKMRKDTRLSLISPHFPLKPISLFLKLHMLIGLNLSWQKGRGLEAFFCCENEQDRTNDLTEGKVIAVNPLLRYGKDDKCCNCGNSFSENWSCTETTEFFLSFYCFGFF